MEEKRLEIYCEKFREKEDVDWQMISKADNNLISEEAGEQILNNSIKKGVVNILERPE